MSGRSVRDFETAELMDPVDASSARPCESTSAARTWSPPDLAAWIRLCVLCAGVFGLSGVAVTARADDADPACDDGRRCTAGDRLVDGVCSGTPYSCHDGLECTNDLCDGAGGCRHFIASGFCLIGEQCYERDDSVNGNACRICDPSHSNVAWHEPSGRPCLGGVCREGACVVSLNIQRRGTGTGVVLGKRMLCDRDCSFELPAGTRVRLTAEPARGSQFEGWSGACTGAGECVVEMAVGASVYANFGRKAPVAPPVQLIVEKEGDGVVTSFPSGVDCGEHCWHTFTHGTTVTLYATPRQGMEFKGWRGGCHGKTRECSVELRAAQLVSAEFGEARRHRFAGRSSTPSAAADQTGRGGAAGTDEPAEPNTDADDLVGPPVPQP